MQIGLHVSISGSIANAVTNAVERECSAFQIFTGNPRGWYSKDLTNEDVSDYKKNLSECDIDRFATVAHMPYLPNLSTPDISSYEKSIKAMIREVERCAKIGIPYLVTHLGSHKGSGEENGREYHFLTRDEFVSKVARAEFLEHAEVYGNFYGVPRSEVRDSLKSGKDVILKIDVQGAATIRTIIPEAILIFIVAESRSELISRLSQRQTESPEELQQRISTAEEELGRISEFDYRVINKAGDVQNAVNTIDSILSAEKARLIPRMAELI